MATVLNSNFGPWRVATSANHEKVGIIDQLGRPCLHFEEDGPIDATAICKNSPENLSDLQQWVAKWNEEFHSGERWPVTATPPELQALEAVWPSTVGAQTTAICMLKPEQAAAVLKLAGKLCQQEVLLALEYQSSAPYGKPLSGPIWGLAGHFVEIEMPNVTKEEALLLIEGLLADMLMLKTGAWVPDDDSIDASCEAIWRLQEFVEALPCDS